MASFNILPIRRAGDGSDLTEEDSVFPGDNLVFQPARDEQPRKRLKSSVSTQPLNDIPHDFVLPFKGRDALMLEVAKTIQSYVHTFATTSIKREGMLFIVFEGLAGVGKTRCLFETPKQVEKVVANSDNKLAKLYTCKGVRVVYLTFNGSGAGSGTPHFFHPEFMEMNFKVGPFKAGQSFMQACIVSEILYGQPWGNLPSELQVKIKEESTLLALKRIGDHLREEKLPADQMLALYLLIDESQILAQTICSHSCDGLEFVRGMFSWIALVMTTSSLCKVCNLCLIPIIAGTVVPAIGKWGVSDWLAVQKQLAPLDLNSAVEVLEQSVNDQRFTEVKQGVKILLHDCSCVPRLIWYVYSAWEEVMSRSLPTAELVSHLRQMVFVRVAPWVDFITVKGNLKALKDVVRLCLTGAITEDFCYADECRNGWVYVEQVEGGGWRYRSPRILVRSIAERIKVPARSIPILPVVAKGDPLEDAFLDTFLALLCLNEGKSIPLSNLFIGALGDDAILNMKVEIGREVMQVVEKYQFYNPRDRRFYHEGDAFTVGADENIYYLHPCGRQSPRLPLLLRCKRNAAVTDARLFLRNDEGEVCEFWIQLKGGKDPMRKGDAEKCREAAFRPELKVPGRRKILVLCTTSGFSFHVSSIDERIEQKVLFMNLMHFMPDFLTHCVEN